MNKNKRKGKIPYTLWLKPEEERVLNEYIENGMFINACILLEDLHNRGDFEKR